ncbi:MAG: NAD(P)H-dependent oxidoreductase subunit E [Chloroflexi bacterium]|nr:NAD(P)H-dependent oxidoreductase subunit E [Chloroflexota bacterium]
MREKVEKVIDSMKGKKPTILSALLAIQEEIGYIPKEAIPEVAGLVGASANEVYGVITFYTHFRLEPPGEHFVEVCWGPSCHVCGGKEVMDAVLEELGLSSDGTTKDKKLTLKRTSCAAACAQGPVISIDHNLRGRMTPEKAREMLARVKSR